MDRSAGTMMQRMSDMLTRWLEGAMRRAENEAETDENPDQSDLSEHDSPAVSVQADTVSVPADAVSVPADASATVEDRLEASVQDVADLRLPPSPVNDATALEIVNDVLCSASREVKENISLADPTTQPKCIDSSSADRTSETDNVALNTDSNSIVDSHLDCQSPENQESEADDKLSCTLQLQPESDVTNSGCNSTSIAVDGADSDKLCDMSCSSVGTDNSLQMQNQCDQVTDVEQCEAVMKLEKSPASPGQYDFLI